MIRAAGAWDVKAIATIWNELIRDSEVTFNAVEKTETELVRLMRARADRGFGFFVAEEAREVLGFATYGQFRAGSGYARTMEHTIHLAPGARRKGKGRALMATLEDHARAAGVHSLIGAVSADNDDAIAFHTAIGYSEAARLAEVGWKNDRWFDLVLMQKVL